MIIVKFQNLKDKKKGGKNTSLVPKMNFCLYIFLKSLYIIFQIYHDYKTIPHSPFIFYDPFMIGASPTKLSHLLWGIRKANCKTCTPYVVMFSHGKKKVTFINYGGVIFSYQNHLRSLWEQLKEYKHKNDKDSREEN